MHRKLIILLSLLYIFFASWTSAFKVGGWLPLYQICILFAFALVLIDRHFKIYFQKEDMFLMASMIVLFISSIFHAHDKTMNYMMAYFYVFVLLYLVFKSTLIHYRFDLKKILNINSIAVIIVCFFSSTEFFLEFLFNIEISEYILRTREATATYMPGVPRSYGFSTEPTALAMYINTLGPIALWNINQWNISRVTKYFIILTIALGWFFTFSAAGFLFFTLSFIISLVIYRKVHILFTKKTIIFWLGFLAILLINFEICLLYS